MRLPTSDSGMAWYGAVAVWPDSASLLLVLPQAFSFPIAGLWLLTVTNATLHL